MPVSACPRTRRDYVELESSAVKRAAYDAAARILDLWYTGGDRYSYFDVPGHVYRRLLETGAAGQSVGAFVNARIKPFYRYEIEPRRRRFRPDI